MIEPNKDTEISNHDSENGYWDGKLMSSRALRAASTIGVIGTLGASLTVCSNDTNRGKVMEENSSMTEPYAEVEESKSSVFVMYDEARWENIERWSTLEPIDIKKDDTQIETVGNSQVILLPVQNDYFYNTSRQPSLVEMPAGINLEIKDIYSFKGDNGQIVRFTVLPNIMGSKSIPILLLDSGHLENDEYVADYKNYKGGSEEKKLANFSYLVGTDEVYPNKVSNILTAMEQLALFQEKEGMFVKGQEYSYLDLIGLNDLQKFKDGFTSSRSVVRGGGVCAGATLLSNTLYELGKETNTPWENIVKEKWAHPSMYYVSPFATNDFVTDATVQLSKESQERSYDFRWSQPEDAYLKIDITLIPNSLDFSETEPFGVGGQSDVEFMLTLSFTNENPGDQSEMIRGFINAYEKYRNSQHSSIPSLLQENQQIKELDWRDPTLQVLMDYVYPEQRVTNFETELLDKGGLLSQIVSFEEVVNSLPEDFSGNLGDYIRTTPWYSENAKEGDLDAVLNMLNYTKIEGQPLQCVGFAIWLSALTKGNLNVQDVGGAHSFGSGTLPPARTATELIPYKLFNDEYLLSASTGYGGVALASKNMSIQDYKAGDLFIRADIGGYVNSEAPDGSQITYHTGHIGAILGTKVVDGETVLLVADSNRRNDGKIMIFEVTEHNFYKIFGEPGVRKYIIRSAANIGN